MSRDGDRARVVSRSGVSFATGIAETAPAEPRPAAAEPAITPYMGSGEGGGGSGEGGGASV